MSATTSSAKTAPNTPPSGRRSTESGTASASTLDLASSILIIFAGMPDSFTSDSLG